MSKRENNAPSRRDVIKTTGQVAAATALASVTLPQVHAGENNTIKIALVGCGGRGTGAIIDALHTTQGPTQLVAMADVFQDRLDSCYRRLQRSDRARQIDVPENRRFIGFDAYRRAMDCLRPGDVVILTTPPAFRWVHFTGAIDKRLNVFMEKPVTVDGPSTRRMLDLAQQSERHNLKVGVGLMCRHCVVRKDLYNRIHDNHQIGDIILLRCYRMHGPVGSAFTPARPANSDMTELLYQIRNFHSFLWASGGCYSDFYIHNIDECCWMKNAWPVEAKAVGGRHYRGNNVDQNFDHYSVEYTFADGAKLILEGRTMTGCHQEFASYAHGTRGSAVISRNSHTPARCRIYNSQNMTSANTTWRGPRQEPNPYRVEWEDLMRAIRRDQRYNEVRRGAEASLVTAMGRMAAHTGQVITLDQMRRCEHEFAPQVARFEMNSPAPLQADEHGKYPVPRPGIETRREF